MVSTDLLLLGTLEDVLPVLLLDSISNADSLANDVDAAEDAAAGGDGEGKDCGVLDRSHAAALSIFASIFASKGGR